MKELNIVRGDLKNKPESSKQLITFFESIKTKLEGTLYIGYPIIGTSQGGFQIDALLLTKETGLVIINVEEGADNTINYIDIQDENYTKLASKLLQHKNLTKKRKLAVEINTMTYCPAWSKVIDENDDYPCIINNDSLSKYINSLKSNDEEYFEQTLSVLQSITSIRKNKSRDYIKSDTSRGAKLKKLEDSIANLDRQQSSAVIETVEGVQRIRGLAGSGKTIILALKVAYLHAKNPDWKIAVTFNTRSLKDQFRKYITLFSYEHINEEPNWDKIDIIHAWGTPSSEGVYFNICIDYNIEYYDFKAAKSLTRVYGKEFDKVCEKALNEISEFRKKYDLIVIDEAQDFSKDFLKICYNILGDTKRLVYAYDELQSLNTKAMASPEKIFGNDENGEPLVTLVNDNNQPKQDIILYKCYRNSSEILSTAHALGFGIYRDNLVQMFDNSSLWNDIGYKLIDGKLDEGEKVTLKRTNETSPAFLSEHSDIDDLLKFEVFKNNNEQIDYIVSQILKNINEDELRLDDIMVINPNPLTTKTLVGAFRKKLYDNGVNSSLAGVTDSPDIFYNQDTITFTGIYRAKGNEAAMVYIINSQFCFSGVELAKKRNILFTAMTRSKAWVRVCGYGPDMVGLKKEYKKVKKNDFSLTFKYPTAEEREHMNIVNRDMSAQEKNRVEKNQQNLGDLFNDLKEGKILKEDLPKDLIDQLRNLL
ncbi:DEAD/DEAH box helicase [Psychroserpens sp. SPM9]|uniref:DEAD/DEAH box helicase n=1 Tax=Psychroserpens sp. SPM9 TaxID=2975598 RepID=UPI0021A5E46D|nr:ATP-binding domain-containing protein [Psychroserpens sp. SPM9]MDG5493236.1 ATP-binding domain-containing protein [Psychroserpens sp. SPM9]